MSFSVEFFKKNRDKLLDKIEDGIIVIGANGLLERSNDVAFPFRQDSTFWYLTGIQQPDFVLVIVPGETSFLVCPPRTAIQEIFDGAHDFKEIKKQSGIERIFDYKNGWEEIVAHALKASKVYTQLSRHHQTDIYENASKVALKKALKEKTGTEKLTSIMPQVAELRMIKQANEIQAIQKAVDISIDSFRAVMMSNWQKKFTNEASIANEFRYKFGNAQADVAYQPIVAAGKNACTLHYIDNNKNIKPSDTLLIDAGAEYNMYAADITRVYTPTKLNKRQLSVLEAVQETNQFAQNLIKPGVLLKDIEEQVEARLGRFLKNAGLITSQDHSSIRKYYPHSFSHHLGLDVHDVADYTRPLERNMVITVEPGLYIPEWNLGIRLEDDVVVTESGSKNMSARLPYC